jgi:hypothetical protein
MWRDRGITILDADPFDLLAAPAGQRPPLQPTVPVSASQLSPPQPAAAPAGQAPAVPDAYQYDAFVSYNQKDGDWVETVLLPRLERAGLRLCLARSRRTLLILTPNWGASQWSEFEGLLAQTSDPIGNRRRVLPVIAQTCALPARLEYLTPLDLTRPSRFDAQMQRLVAAIRATPDSGDPAVATVPTETGVGQQPQQAPTAGDGRMDYERGLRALEPFAKPEDSDEWRDFNLYKGQLLENQRRDKRFGSTETLRNERASIVDNLNPLALKLTGLSFVDLCLGRRPERQA